MASDTSLRMAAFPDVVGNALRNMLSSNNITTKIYRQFTRLLERTLAHRDPLACIMPWFGQGVDVSNGTMTLKGSELDLAWESGPSEPVIQALIDRHKAYSAVTGGTVVESPMWSLFKFLVTPHPLGGCNMGTTSKDGVVDHTGEVFNYPRLYVMDSAVVPRALGLNPSRTIAALAERNSALIE